MKLLRIPERFSLVDLSTDELMLIKSALFKAKVHLQAYTNTEHEFADAAAALHARLDHLLRNGNQ